MTKNELILLVISAFAGGFFSYLFTRAKDVFDKYENQISAHLNSLTKSERNLIANLMILKRNQPTLENYHLEAKKGNLFTPLFHPYIVDRSLSDNTLSLKIINLYANCCNSIDHHNQSLIQFSKQYNELRNLTLEDLRINDNKEENKVYFLLNALKSKIENPLQDLIRFQHELEEEILFNIASNQIAYEIGLNKFRFFSFFTSWTITLPDDMQSRIEENIKQLKIKITKNNNLEW